MNFIWINAFKISILLIGMTIVSCSKSVDSINPLEQDDSDLAEEILTPNPNYRHLNPDQLANIFIDIQANSNANLLRSDGRLRKLLGAQAFLAGAPRSVHKLSGPRYKKLFQLAENGCFESIQTAPNILFPSGIETPSIEDIKNLYVRFMSKLPTEEELDKVIEIRNSATNKALSICTYLLSSLEGMMW